MAKQSGPCAFTNACSLPGPRLRLAGTNRTFCPLHFKTVSMPAPGAEVSILTAVQNDRIFSSTSRRQYFGINTRNRGGWGWGF